MGATFAPSPLDQQERPEIGAYLAEVRRLDRSRDALGQILHPGCVISEIRRGTMRRYGGCVLVQLIKDETARFYWVVPDVSAQVTRFGAHWAAVPSSRAHRLSCWSGLAVRIATVLALRGMSHVPRPMRIYRPMLFAGAAILRGRVKELLY